MRRGSVTIKEVAEAAGVHASTVSRALSPATRHLISEEIRGRIEAVAQELGYARNTIASSLRTRRSMMVGVLVPDITNPMFPPMLRGIEDALGPDYMAVIANTDNDPEREAQAARRLLARGVDGLILATVRRRDPLVDELREARVPLVLLNRTLDRGEVSAVVSDDAHGMQLVVEHLAALGHRRIAHLAGPQDLSTGAARLRAFKEAMRTGRLDIDEHLIVVAKSYSLAEGRRLADQILAVEPPPTALVAANDLLALGAYEAAAGLGYRIPVDLSVTGFNDMPLVERMTPPLTTVRIQHYELGVHAAQLLAKQLDQPHSPKIAMSLGVSLEVRGSTAAPRATTLRRATG